MSDESPSKTQRKKQMHELQDLGTELVDLNEQQLAAIDLPESLLEAVMEARRISKFEARRRQMQYIGKLMRSIDPAPIRERIDTYKAVSRSQTARLHLIERWRTRLLEDENALTAFLSEHPGLDATQMRQVIRNALRERDAGQPPKNFRALFQLLNDVIDVRTAESRDE
jgi:ribosome-associated protein